MKSLYDRSVSRDSLPLTTSYEMEFLISPPSPPTPSPQKIDQQKHQRKVVLYPVLFLSPTFYPLFGNLTLIKMGLNWRRNYINLGCLKWILTNIYNVTSVHRLGEIVILKISNKPLFSILSFRVWLNFLQLQYCNPYKYKMFGAYNGLYIGCSIGFS